MAVLLRTHLDDPKVRHSIDALSLGTEYDFFVLAREDEQAFDFAPAAKVGHTLQDIRDLGFRCEGWYDLVHRSDLLFPVIAQRLPGYSHYVMVEYDVFVQHPDRRFFDRFAAALQQADAPDLVMPWLAPAKRGWGWDAAVLRTYPKVIGSAFGVVSLSARAVPYVLEERRREEAWAIGAGVTLTNRLVEDNVMFCEAFLPSAIEDQGGFRSCELNALLPGAYHPDYFRPGPARLLSEQLDTAVPGELIHPVVHDYEFMAKTLAHYGILGDAAGFIAQARGGRWAVAPSIRDEFIQRAQAVYPEQMEGVGAA